LPGNARADTTPRVAPRPAAPETAPATRRQPGAPNLFDLRPSARADQVQQPTARDSHFLQVPLVAGAFMALALLLVALRFWAENLVAPAYGLGQVAVNAREEVAVVVNDSLMMHERAGLDRERIALSELGIGNGATIRFFRNGDLLVHQPRRSDPMPAWLKAVLGLSNGSTGTLSRCQPATRRCTLLRDDIEHAMFLVEPRTDHILLADIGKHRLEKISASGERLAVTAMELTPPVALALNEGLLYMTRGDRNTVSVLKPDTEDFARELDSLTPGLDGLEQAELIFPTALAALEGHWWAVLQSRDATTAGLFRFDSDWQAAQRIDLPGNALPYQLVEWAGKLLAPDARREVIHRVAADGSVEKPFNDEAVAKALAERRGQIAWSRALQALVLIALSLGAVGLFALGTVQSLQRKLYRPHPDVDEARFDINDEAIEWLAPAEDVEKRLRYLGFGMAATALLLLIGAFVAQFSAPALLAICLLSIGLGGYTVALQRASGCHIGQLDDQIILVDHNNTYRVGRGSRIQYINNFVMIDDVIVFLGSRFLPRFAGEQLQRQFAPLVTRGIKVDRTTLRLKLMSSRHPLLYGTLGLVVCCCSAIVVLLLS
jgi:hypothetical protein